MSSALEELDALIAKAGPLPWAHGYRRRGDDIWSKDPEDLLFTNSQRRPANAALAVHAVNHLPLLVAVAEEANADLLAIAESIEEGQLTDMRAQGGDLPRFLRARAGKNAEALAALGRDIAKLKERGGAPQ